MPGENEAPESGLVVLDPPPFLALCPETEDGSRERKDHELKGCSVFSLHTHPPH